MPFIRLYAKFHVAIGRVQLEFLIRAYIYVLLLAFALILERRTRNFADNETRRSAAGRNEGTRSLGCEGVVTATGRDGKGSNLIRGGEREYAAVAKLPP